MSKFCRTHVVDRSIPELRQRKYDLEARDLSGKPGLQAEYGRVCSMLSLRLVEHQARWVPSVYPGVREWSEVEDEAEEPGDPMALTTSDFDEEEE